MKSLFIVISLMFLIGCTRDLGDQSQIKIDLSKVISKASSSADDRISFVAVNVTGPGMARKTFVFDAFDNCDGDCENSPPAPSTVALEVPSGANRLVQVLVIAETVEADGSESEEFRYGERLVPDVSGASTSVPVTVTAEANSTNKEGSASGRYLFADGSAFTGQVALEFKPKTGSPAMEVFKLDMFNGWFQIHLLDNIDLTYRMSNGHVMFGGPVKQSSSIFNANVAVKKIIAPKLFNDDGSPDNDESLDAVGFWKGGQPDLSKNVCHDSTPETSNDEFTDNTGSSPLAWPTDFTISGGGLCTASDPLVTNNEIKVGGEILENGGGGAAPFRGPYMFFDNGFKRSPLGIDISDPTRITLSWKYLPGAVNSKMVGSTAFFKVETGIDDGDFVEGGNGLDCDALPTLGFQRKAVSGNTESVTLNIPSSDLGDAKVILCPRKPDGTHFRTAIETRCLGGNCGDGGGLPPATKLKLVAPFHPPAGYPHLNDDACTAFEIHALDDTDNIASLPNPNYQVDLSATGGTFYVDPGCGTAVSTPHTIFGPVSHVWFEGAGPGNANLQVSANVGETQQLTGDSSQNPAYQNADTAVALQVFASNEYFVEDTDCDFTVFTFVDVANVPTQFAGSGPNPGLSSTGNGKFFAPGDCNGTIITDIPATAGDTNLLAEFAHSETSATSSLSFTMDSSGLGPAVSDGVHSYDVFDPAATHARIEKVQGGQSLVVGNCIEFSARTFEASPFKAPRAKIGASESYNITFTGVTGDLFANIGDCSGPTNAQSSITVNQTSGTSESETFFFSPSSTGTLEFNGEALNDPQFDAESDSFGIGGA